MTADGLLRYKHQLFLSALFILCGFSIAWSRSLYTAIAAARPAIAQPPLYLPHARYVRLATLGFDNFTADILWFNTINYFGKEYLGTRDYRWLDDMCNLVTLLDNRAMHVYEFCATLLSWVAKEPNRSTELLNRAVAEHPEFWRFRYLRGFNHWYFHNRKDLAQEDFSVAARLPDAPPFLASLASRLMVSKNEIDNAIVFLEDLIRNTGDRNAKSALEERLKRAWISKNERKLELLLQRFEAERGRPASSLQELVDARLLQFVPQDGFGGTFALAENRKVVTTSGEKGLEFFGKTAETGIYSQTAE